MSDEGRELRPSTVAKPKRRRVHHLRVPVLPEEENAIKQQAHDSRLSIAEYMRRTALGTPIESRHDQEGILALAKVNGDMGRLGGLFKKWLIDNPDGDSGNGIQYEDVKELLGNIKKIQGELLYIAENIKI